ncbi:unnamed protein product [Leptosia nina]|uniref:Uncharacterized protein n=1 Tax=Leptosia nina TaxID=320188 RepID=A0AAV1JP02_9NEOP
MDIEDIFIHYFISRDTNDAAKGVSSRHIRDWLRPANDEIHHAHPFTRLYRESIIWHVMVKRKASCCLCSCDSHMIRSSYDSELGQQ